MTIQKELIKAFCKGDKLQIEDLKIGNWYSAVFKSDECVSPLYAVKIEKFYTSGAEGYYTSVESLTSRSRIMHPGGFHFDHYDFFEPDEEAYAFLFLATMGKNDTPIRPRSY